MILTNYFTVRDGKIVTLITIATEPTSPAHPPHSAPKRPDHEHRYSAELRVEQCELELRDLDGNRLRIRSAS